MRLWGALDPRAKALCAVVLSVALALAPALRALVAFFPALLLAISAGGSRGRMVAVLRGVVALWALSFLANAFLMGGTRWGPEVLGWARPTQEGMRAGLESGARLGALACVGAWAAAVIGVLDLASSLEWTVRGFPPARRVIHRACFPIVLALRMVPLLVEEAGRLREVERLRKGPRGRAAELLRLARMAPVWLVLVVERAESLALALTLRGYRVESVRGFARKFRFGPSDGALVGGALAVAWLLGGAW